MKHLMLAVVTAGLAVVAVLVYFADEGRRQNAHPLNESASHEQTSQSNDLTTQRESGGLSTSPGNIDRVPGTVTKEVNAPPSLPTSAPFGEADAQAVRQNLEALFANAEKADILEAYKEAARRLPPDFNTAAHDKKIADGDFRLLGHEEKSDDGETVIPSFALTSNTEVFGLVRMSRLDDGRVVETIIELEDLGPHASLAVELAWFGTHLHR